MSAVEVDQLLLEVSPDSPCGENLKYNPLFNELERAAAGKPEQRIGDSVIPAQAPDWQDVKTRSVDLLRRTKDLRVAVHLTRSLLHTDGFSGLQEGLELVGGLLERYWDEVYPTLDPEDGNDPTFRLNALANLSGFDGMVRALRERPLVTARVLGSISLRDVEIANGTVARPADAEGEPPDQATIGAAFSEADLGGLKTTADGVRGSLTAATRILAIVDEKVNGAGTVDLSRLMTALEGADAILTEQLARRGSTNGAPASDGPTPGRGAAMSGEVSSREDVIRVLDKACEYFRRHEPSSPVPLLLERAKKLVTKNFLEIVKDMAPGGLSEVKSIGGIEDEE